MIYLILYLVCNAIIIGYYSTMDDYYSRNVITNCILSIINIAFGLPLLIILFIYAFTSGFIERFFRHYDLFIKKDKPSIKKVILTLLLFLRVYNLVANHFSKMLKNNYNFDSTNDMVNFLESYKKPTK